MTSYYEVLIVNGYPVVACMCEDPELRGHYHPMCPDYCERCNTDSHHCPGCGTVGDHYGNLCGDCEAEPNG